MNSYKNQFINAIKAFVIFTILCGLIYTAIVTVIAQTVFPKQANGSMIEENGKTIGSELIAQPFTSEKYMWGRTVSPDFEMFTNNMESPVYYASPSNISPCSSEYGKLVRERAEYIKASNPSMKNTPVPEDLVTISGSGQDPDISYNAAEYQAARIAKNNNISVGDVNSLIEKATNHKFMGIMGEKTVNVLKFNIMLDQFLSR